MAGLPPETETDPNYADVQRRLEEILQQHPLPLRTEQEAASPLAQRQEKLSAGDPYELDIPEQPSDSRSPIGATVGGLMGMVAGAPGGIIPAAGMGALGSAGGEAIQQLIERALGSRSAPNTTGQAAEQMGKEAAFGALGEFGGRLVGKGVSKLVQRSATAEAEEVQRMVSAGLPFQGKPMLPEGTPLTELFLTPAEQTGGQNYIRTLQNVAEGSFGGKSMMEEFKSNRDTFLSDGMDAFTQTIGKKMPPDQLGDLISGEIKGGFAAAKAPARAVYNFLTTNTMPKKKPVYAYEPSGVLLPSGAPHMLRVQKGVTDDPKTGAWVDLTGIKKSLVTDKAVADTLRGLGAKEGGDDVVKTTLEFPDKVPYYVAQKLRSRLQSMADVFSVENKRAPALGIIHNLAGQVDKQIEQGLKDFTPDAANLWRYANQTYRGANEEFNNSFLRGVLKNTDRKDIPEVILGTILQPQKYSDVLKLKTAVGPETWGTVQRSALERVITKSYSDVKERIIDPLKLEQNLYGVSGLGKEKMEALYDAEQRKWINKFIEVAHSTASKSDATGKMAIQLAQPGQMMAATAFAGSFLLNAPISVPGSAAAILLGPPALARIMTHPQLSKLFVQAMQTPAKAPNAGAVVGRLFSAMMPREYESQQTSRGTERMQPSTQPDQYGGLNLP